MEEALEDQSETTEYNGDCTDVLIMYDDETVEPSDYECSDTVIGDILNPQMVYAQCSDGAELPLYCPPNSAEDTICYKRTQYPQGGATTGQQACQGI